MFVWGGNDDQMFLSEPDCLYTKLLALHMYAHGANVRKTTTLTKFARGC